MAIVPYSVASSLFVLEGKTLDAIVQDYRSSGAGSESYSILLFWARQKNRLDTMREKVLDAINAEQNLQEATNLQQQLVLEEARVIGWVLTKLQTASDKDTPAGQNRLKLLQTRLGDSYVALKSRLDDIADKETAPALDRAAASTLRTQLFGAHPSGRPREQPDKVKELKHKEPARQTTQPATQQRNNAQITIDPNADIGGELSFDDGTA